MEGKSPFNVIDIGGGCSLGLLGSIKGLWGQWEVSYLDFVGPVWPLIRLPGLWALVWSPGEGSIVSSFFYLTSLYFMKKVKGPAQDNDPIF